MAEASGSIRTAFIWLRFEPLEAVGAAATAATASAAATSSKRRQTATPTCRAVPAVWARCWQRAASSRCRA